MKVHVKAWVASEALFRPCVRTKDLVGRQQVRTAESVIQIFRGDILWSLPEGGGYRVDSAQVGLMRGKVSRSCSAPSHRPAQALDEKPRSLKEIHFLRHRRALEVRDCHRSFEPCGAQFGGFSRVITGPQFFREALQLLQPAMNALIDCGR